MKFRHGRATVIDERSGAVESQTFRGISSFRHGTRVPEGYPMTTFALPDDSFIPVSGASAIPLKDIAPWAVFGLILALVMLYFVSTEQGATSLFKGMYVHEFVHDGRHLLGFPCH